MRNFRDRSMGSNENSLEDSVGNNSADTGSPERSFIGMKDTVMKTLDASNMHSRASPKLKNS